MHRGRHFFKNRYLWFRRPGAAGRESLARRSVRLDMPVSWEATESNWKQLEGSVNVMDGVPL